jgi:hypothetical protein
MTTNTSAKGLTIIGFFTWWNIRQIKIKKEAVLALLKKCKIDYTPELLPVRCLFTKAVEQVKVKHIYKGLLIRKISKSPDEYKFGLVDEHIDPQAETLEYSHNATMYFDPKEGELTVDKPHRAFDLVVAAFHEFDEYYDSEDIRAMILDIIKRTYSIGVRDRGGIYFIPAKFEKEVEALEKFVRALGSECYFAIAPQIDMERTKVSIHKAFSEEMHERVTQYKEELENGLHQTGALEKRLEEYQQLQQELQFYSASLSFQATDIMKELTDLETTVSQKLLG